MIEITAWAEELAQKLERAFGERLRFVGYQGSYGRGEATEESDIDIVAVLDRLELPDLAHYRRLVAEMPSGELACGFICGERELRAWPRYDLLALVLDTRPVRGDLKALTPALGPEDARQALALGASALYHGACHGFLYGGRAAALGELRKQAFFCLRMAHLCRTGEYVASRGALLPKLEPEERELLAEENPYQAYRLLIWWSGAQLYALGPEEL